MRGKHLERLALTSRFEFKPPVFLDLGLSDIPLFRSGHWRWKHQNLAFFASRGQRPYMEDRMHYMFDPYNSILIFSIFDGHGGPYVSQYLEKNYANALRRRLLEFAANATTESLTSKEFRDCFAEAIITEVHNLDDAISRMHASYTLYTGSTLISVILEKHRYLTVVNVGDSRAVACDGRGRAVPLSEDHKPSDVS
ncbi:unnamed protein product [Enterobius vermicularis]|uniref:PPM-type phosphatase domain-containing protein n=1 Tax=Enterobius vermicularis TaxID=51028 RepID=A0A0N4UTM0_ENTVE|nr:unnamed protein product [Enterobius vermicularis]